MSTILWMVENVLSIAVIALVIVLQPELRKALETLGQKNIFNTMISFDNARGGVEGNFSDKTVTEIVHACEQMGKVKTGALIVIERNVSLTDYERTGIEVDALVSSQLLINIFEHNTPLHDGAIIMRGNRIVSATCYLPLSDNRQLSKQLGTRHRAAVGISEETDALTVIVSEETGHISVTESGNIMQNITLEQLKEQLVIAQDKTVEEKKVHFFWEGRSKREKHKK
jgi:diadenylate cyclase